MSFCLLVCPPQVRQYFKVGDENGKKTRAKKIFRVRWVG